MHRLLLASAVALLAPASVVAAAPSSPTPPVQTLVVPSGPEPCGMAVEDGRLWIAVYGSGRLLELDAVSGRVVGRARVGRFACRLAVTRDAVWVTRDQARELVRVDRHSGRVRRVALDDMPLDVLVAAGSVWATGFDTGTVARIDPASGRILDVVRVGGSPAGLAACGGRIWVGHSRAADWVTAIDPAGLRIRRVRVGAAEPREPHCVRGTLWITTEDTVLRLDPRRSRVLSRLRVGETLGTLAAGPDGLVWVTDKQHNVVHRLDARGSEVVDSFPAGPGAFALARVGRSMWVTSYAGSDVRRFDP